jgi:diguanylate cyclase (GGDEF)-like protein
LTETGRAAIVVKVGIPRKRRLTLVFARVITVLYLVVGLIQYLVVSRVTEVEFNALERDDAASKMAQVVRSLEREMRSLRVFTASYAAWGEAYDYMARPSASFIETNFGPAWSKTYGIDFVIFLGLDGRRVWSSRDKPYFRGVDVPSLAAERFDPADPVAFPAGPAARSSDARVAFAKASGGAMLYCAHPITDDALKAPPRGVLIFGRLIDDERLADFAFGPRTTLTLVASREDSAAGASGAGTGISIAAKGPIISAYYGIADASGAEMGELRLSMPRDIRASGRDFILTTCLCFAVIALASLFAVTIAVKSLVIGPVDRLAAWVEARERGATESTASAETARDDEIGSLAASFAELVAISERQNEELSRLAGTDQLTGAANRRQLESHADRELKRILRDRVENSKKGILAIVILDVDLFKSYNDRYGHVGGDACLKAIVEAASACLRRPSDLLCRFGGEEFLAFLPGTDEDGAMVVAESIRSSIEGLGLTHSGSPYGVITVSAGAAAEKAGEDFLLRALIERADEALYRAKGEGRNRCARASEGSGKEGG